MEVLKIDGSFGEGGGQILRSAITLSCITKKPIQIDNIRQNRKVPGLRAQHLVTIKLLAKICDAKVEGLYVGSTSIKFFPNEIQSTRLKENIGTAGSISLILQALIPAVSLGKKKLDISIKGGTDVPWSPTINYTKYVVAEAYSRIGVDFAIKIQKRGYYPKGGGLVEATVFPCKKLRPLILTKRNEKNANIVCTYSNLNASTISHAVNYVKNTLEKNGFSTSAEINEESAINQGSSMLVFNHDQSSIIGSDELFDYKQSTEFGKKSVSAFIDCHTGVDLHLSDMMVTPLSLINGLSIFTVEKISKHLETNLYITSKITGCKYGIGKIEGGFEIRIEGNSDSCIQ
jgi:RNA 3'-terminal phosphate cyclase (ATP)